MYFDESLHVAHNDLSQSEGLALASIMHNERYFLPQFLEHYRKIGVERFFLIDDNSNDGSTEFAKNQNDVCLLNSDFRYGAKIVAADGQEHRSEIAWRNTLMRNYLFTGWSIQLDLDEFLAIPNGKTLPDLVATLPRDAGIVWGSMIDLYPKSWEDFRDRETDPLDGFSWFFDARPHIKLSKRTTAPPIPIYSGVRARLSETYLGANKSERLDKKLRRAFYRNPYAKMGTQYKPALINWSNNFSFRDAHRIKNATATPHILPIMHYKFAPNSYQRFTYAAGLGSHSKGSQGYRDLGQIFDRMRGSNATFEGPDTRRLTSFHDFEIAKIARGFQ